MKKMLFITGLLLITTSSFATGVEVKNKACNTLSSVSLPESASLNEKETEISEKVFQESNSERIARISRFLVKSKIASCSNSMSLTREESLDVMFTINEVRMIADLSEADDNALRSLYHQVASSISL
jgi:hypothetical protein